MGKIITIYHGNISSRIFHKAGCRYYECRNCKEQFESAEEALRARYRPCRRCEPNKLKGAEKG